jgi:iron(III) transport system substrate-binding protein
MRRSNNLLAAVLVLTMFLPIGSALAEKSVPQVPITYSGDTNDTIVRRAQWIEGAKKEGTAVWWGDLKPDEANKVISEFNKLYPFITIAYARQSSQEKATKLEAEYAIGRVSFDFMHGAEPIYYPRWRKMGTLEKFTNIIPGIGRIPKAMYSQFGDWAQPGNNAIVPMYVTKQVSPAEVPKKWEDLLDPKWKGKMAMTSDMKAWSTLALTENGWGIEKTEDFLTRLKQQQLIWASGHTAGHALLLAGEFKILVEDYLYHCLLSQKKGASVEWVRVSPVPITGQAVTLMKKAPHPNAARLFIEWLFSAPGLKVYEATTQQGAIFPGAGTRQAQVLEGLVLAPRTEEILQKSIELHLEERFGKILGVAPE